MPVSGNEETEVKPMAWQSSDNSADVPIKKRRFPLFCPPSPTPEEQSSLPAENDSLQKEYFSPSQGSTLSNASVAKTSTGLFNANMNAASEEQKGSTNATTINAVQTNYIYSGVKVEEPKLTIQSSSFDYTESKKKLLASQKHAGPLILGKTELQLPPNEALALSVGTKTCSEKNVEGNCKSESSTIAGSTELSLGPKEPLVPALLGQSCGGSSLTQKRPEPVSLDLSLSKGKSSIEGKSEDVELKIGGDDLQLQANRSNWDLNTTVDAWEGSTSDAAAHQVHVNELNVTVGTHDIKNLICLNGMVDGKQDLEGSEQRSNFAISPSQTDQLYTSEDSVHLGLSPSSFQSNFIQKHPGSSAKVDPTRVMPVISLPSGNLNMVNRKTVKSEPFDESTKQNLKGAKVNATGLLDGRVVKPEILEKWRLMLSNGALKLVNPRSIKSEPVLEGNQETVKNIEGTSQQSNKQVLESVDDRSFTIGVPITSQVPCPTKKFTCSTTLSKNEDGPNLSEHSIDAKGTQENGEEPQEAYESAGHIALEKISASMGLGGKESNVPGMVGTTISDDKNVDNLERCRTKLMDQFPTDSLANIEGSASDEEKINISVDMLVDSYDTEYDSDDNHVLDAAMDTEPNGKEDDYEDGEVRDPLVQTANEDPVCEKREVEHINHGDSDKLNFTRFASDDPPTSSHVEEEGTKPEDPVEINNNYINESVVKVLDEKFDKITDKNECLQESLIVEMPTVGTDIMRHGKAIKKKPLDQSGRKDAPKSQNTGLPSDQTTNNSQETLMTLAQGEDDNVNKTDLAENNDSTLPKVEASLNGDDAAKDANSVGNRSRIINLSQAANEPSLAKTSSISFSVKPLPSRAGRERFPDADAALEEDILHRRERDEIYIDSAHKFPRERHQDQLPRNPRMNFMRGKGRMTSRLRSDWEFDRSIGPEFYNGPTEFRVPRHKYASTASHADLEYNGYNIPPDGAFVGTGRGRKPLNDEGLAFRHPPLRRRSPGGRGGPAHGIQMVRRVPRNISLGEDGSELVGLRHSEKFTRGFPDDTIDPMFTRPQPPFEGVDGFVRGNRNFPSVRRRGLPQLHSKSPIRSRTRSPGPWSSPRRRSPDTFGGHPDLPHRRSPPIYRMERMRSPDRSCFAGDIVVRRHCSPPYLSRPSNDLMDMDAGREHGHLRPVLPNRSPTGRIVLRNRRFDNADTRERIDNDEFIGGPVHSGRFHEHGGDGNGDERRRFGERRGPIRTFRPPYNGADGENFHLNTEDGPRPYRFCPEDGSEFHERGNLREREFDRRIKNHPGNATRRTRNIEEQEGNYRHGGQVWHDSGFDDISRVKRKRF